MHRRVRMALATASAAAVAVTGAVGLSACGTSESTAQAATAQGSAAAGQTGDPSAMLTQALDPLVSDGTITSGQEESVVSALASAMTANAASGMQSQPAQPSDGSTPPAMPSDGSTPPAGMPQGGPTAMFSDTLDGLVRDGTLTADQQTAIEDALSSAMPAPGGQPPSGAAPTGSTTTQSS